MSDDFSFGDKASDSASGGQTSVQSYDDGSSTSDKASNASSNGSGGSASSSDPQNDWEQLDYDYDLHDNVVEDLVMYSRSEIALNEPQFLLTTLGYMSGLMENPEHFISGVIIGTSSSGKTKLQKEVVKLFESDWLYEFTTGSDQTLAYDSDWDDCLIASLDELNKPSEDLIEILKSLHGGDEKFTRKVVEDWRNEEMKTLERYAKPYWLLYAQFDSDFELWNRLLKIPVHEGKAKNEAVLRLQFDHHNIEFSDSDYTYDFEFTDGKKAIQDHIRNLPQNAHVKLPAGEDEYDNFDVAAMMAPIFDTQRSETNRVAGMVANLVRSSALLNHKNRETRQIHIPNEGIKEAIIAEPQDVANILSCRDTLLASTHELDRKKKAICSALDSKGGTSNMATIPDVIDYLRQGNAPIVSRTQVENNLAQLIDHYLVEKFEGASEEGLNMYKFQGWHHIGAVKIDDFMDYFAEDGEHTDEAVTNPINGRNFVDSIRDINKDILPSAADFMDEPGVQSNSQKTGGGQATLGGGSDSIELEAHEEAVRAELEATVDDMVLTDMDEHEPSLYEMTGIVSMGDENMSPDVDDTIFDPENPVWNRPDVNSEWVNSADDAFSAVDETMTELHKKGVMKTEVLETDDVGKPVEMRVEVLAEDEL